MYCRSPVPPPPFSLSGGLRTPRKFEEEFNSRRSNPHVISFNKQSLSSSPAPPQQDELCQSLGGLPPAFEQCRELAFTGTTEIHKYTKNAENIKEKKG
jgi:hypothetical protein